MLIGDFQINHRNKSTCYKDKAVSKTLHKHLKWNAEESCNEMSYEIIFKGTFNKISLPNEVLYGSTSEMK